MEESGRMVFVVPHSHIDVEWYWTYETTREWSRDILGRALDLLRRDPAYRFTQDQTVLIAGFLQDLGASDRALLQEMVRTGRLAIVGGTYVQPELVEPCGEALVRQILLGQEWLQAHLGIRARCGWFIDSFGQIPQLPQILRRAGYEYNVFWRDIPPEIDPATMPADFYWEAPDGSRILTHWLPGGYGNDARQARMTRQHSNTRLFFQPWGGDVVRPSADSGTILREASELLAPLGIASVELRVASALEYMDTLAAQASDLPVLSHDFNPALRAHDLRGTYDGRIELKKRNRAAEQALFSAEALAAIAWTRGAAYPQAQFSDLWQRLLFTQFHDTIGGSHHDPVYVAAMERLHGVLSELGTLTDQSLHQIIPAHEEAGPWVAVFNTLSFARRELCQVQMPRRLLGERRAVALASRGGDLLPGRVVDQGTTAETLRVEFVAEVPATGYEVYRLCDGADPHGSLRRTRGEDWIENSWFRVAWNPASGDLVSIWDRTNQREVLSGPGNVIVAAREKDPDMEGNIYLTGEEAASLHYQALKIEILEDALGIGLRILSAFQDCSLLREIYLPDAMARLDLTTTLLDFRGGDVLVKVRFPLHIDWARAQRVYETPFAATQRPDGHYPAQTWVDCSDGVYGAALLNCGTPGYWIERGCLEMVLLRSYANYRGYQENGLRLGVPGYEHSPQTELAREHGTHSFVYTLLPHAGDWRQSDLCRLGQSLNTPLFTVTDVGERALEGAGQSFIAFEPDFVMTGLKQAQSGEGLVVRGFETRGEAHKVTIRLPGWVRHVSRASLLEEPAEPLAVAGNQATFHCAPHEIATLLLRKWTG